MAGNGKAVVVQGETRSFVGAGSRSLVAVSNQRKRTPYQRPASHNPLVYQPRAPRPHLRPPLSPFPREINPMAVTYLFHKQLQRSDVGRTGRIVIPKKVAEAHFPPLHVKEGFWIHIDDMDLPRVWTVRFRFWPNNSSRIYIFENAKNFIAVHGLEYGDYIMVFRDLLTGSYVIRGIKMINNQNQVTNEETINNNSSTNPINVPSVEEFSSTPVYHGDYYFFDPISNHNDDAEAISFAQIEPSFESLNLNDLFGP